MRKHFVFCALAATVLVVPACGGSTSGGPTILSGTVPTGPVAADEDGVYSFAVTVDFSDDVDVDIYNFDADTPPISITQQIDPPAPSGTLPLTIMLPTGTGSGTVNFDVSVEDIDNLTSNDFAGMVVLD
jgi:hypothetical protein